MKHNAIMKTMLREKTRRKKGYEDDNVINRWINIEKLYASWSSAPWKQKENKLEVTLHPN